MKRRPIPGLITFGYFTCVGLALFGYRYLEDLSYGRFVSPLKPLIDQLVTGAWTAAALFPLFRDSRGDTPFPGITGMDEFHCICWHS
jgi:hypothetical protein